MGKMQKLVKNTKLTLCACTLLFALAFSFSPFKMLLLKSKANTATFTSEGYVVTTQSARLPFPTDLIKGRALSFQIGTFSVEELLAFFGGEVIVSETTPQVTLYHAYAKGLGEGERLPFGKVNLQIAVGEGYIAVASPVFYGSF